MRMTLMTLTRAVWCRRGDDRLKVVSRKDGRRRNREWTRAIEELLIRGAEK